MSIRESERRSIREQNLKKQKMVRTKQGLKYEEDLAIQEKQLLRQEEQLYRSSHVGKKIVEAFLLPSARTGNPETNKAKILRYVHGREFKVSEFKDRGHARVELSFDNYEDANKCVKDIGVGGKSKEIIFEIPQSQNV